MRVRQHDGVDPLRVDRQRRPVAQTELLEALEQSAVDQDAVIVRLKEKLRSRHCSDSTKKGQIQGHRGTLPLRR
jgi:hypothetical protein